MILKVIPGNKSARLQGRKQKDKKQPNGIIIEPFNTVDIWAPYTAGSSHPRDCVKHT